MEPRKPSGKFRATALLIASVLAAGLAGCLADPMAPNDSETGALTDSGMTDASHVADTTPPAPTPRDETPVNFFPREGVYDYALTTLQNFLGKSCGMRLELRRAEYPGAPSGLYRARETTDCGAGDSSTYFVIKRPDGGAARYDSATGAESSAARPFHGMTRPAYDTQLRKFAGESVRVWSESAQWGASPSGSSMSRVVVEGFGIVDEYSGYSSGYHGGGSTSFKLARYNGVSFLLN